MKKKNHGGEVILIWLNTIVDDNLVEVRSEPSMDDSDTLSENSQVVKKSASPRKNFKKNWFVFKY